MSYRVSRFIYAWDWLRDQGAQRLQRWRYYQDCRYFRRQRFAYFDYLHALLEGQQYQRTLADVFAADAQRYGMQHWRGRLARVWLQNYRHSGGDLAAVWQDCLSTDESLLLSSAQQAGLFESGLPLLRAYLEKSQGQRRSLAAIVWPAMLAVWVPALMLLATPLYTVPALKNAFQDLPVQFYGSYTQRLFAFAQFVQSPYFVFLLASLGLLCLLLVSIYRRQISWRSYADGMAIIRIQRQRMALRLLHLLSLLLNPAQQSSHSLRHALEAIQTAADPWLRWHVSHMLERIRHGLVGAVSIDTGLLDTELFWFFSDMAQARPLNQAATLTAARLEQALLSQEQSLAWRWRWLALSGCVLLTLSLGLWHYLAMDELRQGLSLFYASF